MTTFNIFNDTHQFKVITPALISYKNRMFFGYIKGRILILALIFCFKYFSDLFAYQRIKPVCIFFPA
jgi:hypothetical protein